MKILHCIAVPGKPYVTKSIIGSKCMDDLDSSAHCVKTEFHEYWLPYNYQVVPQNILTIKCVERSPASLSANEGTTPSFYSISQTWKGKGKGKVVVPYS